MRKLLFEPQAWEELGWFTTNEPKLLKRIHAILENTRKTPFEGIGKPEPLKSNYAGYWSRRITEEHRILYKVDDEKIMVFQLKRHY